ncbi:MAG: HNH endonuclease, partial [Gammaproteobacteria bacterium]|nr:HNH endonuclease [Gammaproteobacteria bacterium]
HPDNFQLLLKTHNVKKKNDNWQRFTFDEQIEYIKAAIKLQAIVAPKLDVEMDESVIDSLIERLGRVYSNAP